MKVLIICSAGGHFTAAHSLQPFWGERERVWVTFRNATTETTLRGERVYWAFFPTNRNLGNLVRNLFLAWRVIPQERPDLILSTGAGVAVPFLIVGRIRGCQTVFVESLTRTRSLSLSARLVLPFLTKLYVHWPQLKARYPQAELVVRPRTGMVLLSSPFAARL